MPHENRGGQLPLIGTGLEHFGEQFQALGDAVAGLIDPERDKRNMILKAVLQSPELLDNIARSQRDLERIATTKATETGKPQPKPNALAPFGITSSDFASMIADLDRETAQELALRQQAAEGDRLGVPEALAAEQLAKAEEGTTVSRAVTGAAQLEIEANRLRLAQKHPDLKVKLETLNLNLDTRTTQAADELFTRLKTDNPEQFATLVASERFNPFVETLLAREQMAVTRRGQDFVRDANLAQNAIDRESNRIRALSAEAKKGENLATIKAALAEQELKILEILGDPEVDDAVKLIAMARFNDISRTADELFERNSGVLLEARTTSFLWMFKKLHFDVSFVERTGLGGANMLNLANFAVFFAGNPDLTVTEALGSANGQALINSIQAEKQLPEREDAQKIVIQALLDVRAKSEASQATAGKTDLIGRPAIAPLIETTGGPLAEGGLLSIALNPAFFERVLSDIKNVFGAGGGFVDTAAGAAGSFLKPTGFVDPAVGAAQEEEDPGRAEFLRRLQAAKEDRDARARGEQ